MQNISLIQKKSEKRSPKNKYDKRKKKWKDDKCEISR